MLKLLQVAVFDAHGKFQHHDSQSLSSNRIAGYVAKYRFRVLGASEVEDRPQ